MVQDRDQLAVHAAGSFRGTVDPQGRWVMVQQLPENEEVFESLAARLRPLMIKRESIYFANVFEALGAVADSDHRERIESLLRSWERAEIQGQQVQAFSLQQSKVDGSEATDFVSDTQLAAAWLYADLVHADAQGPKAAALDFPFRERYAAAVRIFSHIASLTIATSALVESMVAAGLLVLEPWATEDEVVVGESELRREVRAYYAELGTAPPDLRTSGGWGPEWTQLTITDLLRQNSANHVRVELRRGGDVIAGYDSAVIRRDKDATPAVWDVLVAKSMIFKFSPTFVEGRPVAWSFNGIDLLEGTNELRLGTMRLEVQLHDADEVGFKIGDVELFSFEGMKLEEEVVRQFRVIAETLEDIVAVERIVGEELAECTGRFNDRERMRLRQVRLLHEGRLLRAGRGPLRANSDPGSPPDHVVVPAGTLNIGGTDVPAPEVVLWHPQMHFETDEDDGPTGSFIVTIPDGERLYMWARRRFETPTQDDLDGAVGLGEFVELNRSLLDDGADPPGEPSAPDDSQT